MKKHNINSLDGDKLFQERARKTLPYLVRLAKAGQTIYYSDLAEEIDISNPRNFNKILDAVENGLEEISLKTKNKIPRIQDLVVNKTTKLPGYYSKIKDFKKLSIAEKKKRLDLELFAVYKFKDWDFVLDQLGLKPLKSNINQQLLKAKTWTGGRAGGESKEHKMLKEYISKNPQLIGLNPNTNKGILEYKLPSSDAVDVIFNQANMKIAVEVKSKISDTSDILRGLFQCVKYKYLIEAEQAISDQMPNSRVILVLENTFPKELTFIKKLLNVEVIDNFKKRAANRRLTQ